MSDFIPREYHNHQVEALTERATAAETVLRALLLFIDPDILERHGFDWLDAAGELMGVPPEGASMVIPKPKKGRK